MPLPLPPLFPSHSGRDSTRHLTNNFIPGLGERWSTQVHSLRFYYNVAVTARYTSPPGQRLTRPVLLSALEAVIDIHAPLGLTILDEDTPKPHFARLKSINLDQAVSFIQLSSPEEEAQQQEFDGIMAEQHSSSFHNLGQLPVWRVLLIEPEKYDSERGVDVAFVFHHGIGDGATGQAFHIALLKALDDLPPVVEEMQTPYIITPPALPLLGPLETLVALPLSVVFILRMLWTRVWFVRPRPPTFWCGSPIHVGPGGLKTTFRTLSFPTQTVTRLLAACRAEKTTITALLQVLVAKSFFHVLPAETATSLVSSIAINMRRFMPAPVSDETMGVFVYTISASHERAAFASTSQWELARKYRGKLEARVNNGTRNADIGMLKLVSNFEKYWTSRVGKRHESSFELSNLGVFKGTKPVGADGWNIPSRVLFSQSANVASCPVDFSIISVKGGDLMLGISFQEGAVEPELMARVLETLKNELEKTAAGEK